MQPIDIFFSITSECNQKCTKCRLWKHTNKVPLLPINKILNACLNIPTGKNFCIVGGEPLLYKKHVLEIVDGLSTLKYRTVIVTNGVLMDRDFIRTVTHYNLHLVVSIDTIDKEYWKFVRGTDSYDTVLSNLEYAHKILPSGQISIQSVLAKETEYHIKNVAEYARGLNIKHSIQDYIQNGYDGIWTPLEKERGGYSGFEQPCGATGKNLSILQNGDVYTCFYQKRINGCNEPLGNIKMQSIENILNSEYTTRVNEKMKECRLSCKSQKCNNKEQQVISGFPD